jgi:hypothetical protein
MICRGHFCYIKKQGETINDRRTCFFAHDGEWTRTVHSERAGRSEGYRKGINRISRVLLGDTIKTYQYGVVVYKIDTKSPSTAEGLNQSNYGFT